MKNQFKKSFSLFLAVLMLLSSWVWVAPTEAEAVATQYYLKLVSNVTDTGDEDGSKVYVTYKEDNGTGTQTTDKEVASYGQRALEGNDQVVWEGAVDGFPTQIKFQMTLGTGRNEYHKNFRLYVGSSADSCNTEVLAKNDNFEYKGGTNTCTLNVKSSAYPKFTTVSSVAGIEAGTLNKLANGATITKTAAITGGKDQYGAVWAASLPTSGFSYALKNGEGGDISSTYASVVATGSSTNTGGSSATVTLNDDLQKLFPNTKSGTIYLHATYNGTTASGNVKFDNPEYTMTFDANGGKIGADDSSAEDTVTVGGTDSKKYYDTVIGKSPAYRVKAGKKFVNFYDVQMQDVTGKDIVFIDKSGNTVNPTLFKDDETKVGNTGDKTWYALWQSLPITATFVTADNQLIGTLEGRYDNNLEATNMYNGLSGVNAALKAAYDKNGGKGVTWGSDNTPVYKDGATTYTFSHWNIIKGYNDSVLDGDTAATLQGDVTFQAVYTKSTAAKYTVSFYDGNGNIFTYKDANGNEVKATKSDYSFRDDVIIPSTEPTKAQDDKYDYEFIGWAKNIGKNFYAVDAEDKDENGAVISYTSKDGAEFTVRGDASYVPVFRMIPREYSVTFNYTVDGGATESVTVGGYHWLDGVTMPEELKDNYTQGGYRYYIDGWKVGSNATKKQLDDISVEGNLTLTATYGAGIPAVYTINFYDKDGNLLNDGENGNQYNHNSAVTAPTVEQTIDTEDSLFTFVAFKDKNGNTYSATATGDADYYAEYTKKDYADIHYYNYDGTLIYEKDGKENGFFVGDTIPAYSNLVENEDGTTTNALPTKAEDVVGTYNFTGWKDGSGNDVLPGIDKFAGDTYLTAQFETVYKDYTVKFLNDDGREVSEGTYHYGDEIEIPENPVKAADETYTYDFKAWTPEVSEVCYGDATYTATYRRTYNYYKVTWLKDDKSVLSESNYTYNAKIQQAVVNDPVSYEPAETGKTWAFKEWIQCNADGQPVDADGNVVAEDSAARFVRGMRMGTEHLYFYPVFEQKANVLTVTFYKEDGTTKIGEAKVPYGEVLKPYGEAFEEKAAKASDDTYHYIINKWVKVDGGADVTTVTADVSVKPAYTSEKHDKQIYELIIAPTCTETGLAHMKCSAVECTAIDYNVVIDVIPDEGNPAGQVYVGTDKWTLNDYTAGIDYDDVKFVGPNTNVIVNAEDIGTHKWTVENGNQEVADGETAANRGVGKIDYYVSETEVAEPSAIQNWNNVYEYEEIKAEVLNEVLLDAGKTMLDYIAMSTPNNTQKKAIDDEVKAILASYNANATGVLSNLNLINGEEYIIYIRVSDREVDGQSNVCYFSTGKLHYGSTAAEIAVAGDGYGTKFCADATISVNDDIDGFTVYLDDEEITLTDGQYVCEEAGVHTVTVIDKNGNKSTKTFEIKGNHTYRNYTVAATCVNDGSRYDLCTVCGAKANEEVLTKLGHSYTANYVDKAPTCVDDGYRTYTCDNNCGTKLVLKPTDNEATLAQAKKFVEPAEDEDEGTWEALTAADIKHLKATGVHTYDKELDKDGKETENDAWVIDKAATCIVKGSKHKDCTKCGERVTAEVPVDTENGHKFYRDKVTTEPTCTEKGERRKTCRYCGVSEHVAYIDALGHTAGEYKIIKEATCEAKGEKVLTCSVCGVDIGKADENGNYAETPVTEEIDALGHAWSATGEPFKGNKLDENGDVVLDGEGNAVEVWYQKYVCGNDATHVEDRELEDYVEPVAATVTFKNGEADHKVIEGFVGNTITVAQTGDEPVKAADKTKKYTFSHWATKNADGTYTEVKFPIEVKGDATYYAVFAEKYVNYTITYYKEDGATQYKKVGYLHNGEEYALVDGPAKVETWQYTYKFAGWQDMGTDKIYTDKITIAGAHISLKATYTPVLKKYAVTYAYSSSNQIHTYVVDAGEAAPDVTLDFGEITKDFDTKYHYEFVEWNKAAQLLSVENNIYTTPNFSTIEHEFTESVKSAETCTTNRIITKTCECGYSYDVEEANTALGHLWGTPEEGEDGKNIVTCTRDNCGASEEDTRTYTVKFYVNEEDAKALKTVNYVPWGTKVTTLPDDPTKASTSEKEFIFKGWALKGTTDVVTVADIEIKDHTDFVAVFDEKVREYTVIFAYDAYNVIETYTVMAGSDVTYDGAVPTKKFDEVAHYVFSNWSGLEKDNNTVADVQGNVYITAEFDKIKHTYTSSTLGEATCQNGEGTRYTCTCGHFYDITGKPLPHDFEVVERVEATPTKDGYIKSQCKNTVNGARCTEVITEVLKYEDNKVTVKVTVTHNGTPESGIQVEILEKTVTAVPVYGTTNANGIANISGIKGVDYACYVTINGEKKEVTLTADADGNLTGSYAYTDKGNCSCACHRNNFWGAIFRFFHKIIKLFTGEFKCCGNPDPMYG